MGFRFRRSIKLSPGMSRSQRVRRQHVDRQAQLDVNIRGERRPQLRRAVDAARRKRCAGADTLSGSRGASLRARPCSLRQG
jgi:hypothetical protein